MDVSYVRDRALSGNFARRAAAMPGCALSSPHPQIMSRSAFLLVLAIGSLVTASPAAAQFRRCADLSVVKATAIGEPELGTLASAACTLGGGVNIIRRKLVLKEATSLSVFAVVEPPGQVEALSVRSEDGSVISAITTAAESITLPRSLEPGTYVIVAETRASRGSYGFELKQIAKDAALPGGCSRSQAAQLRIGSSVSGLLAAWSCTTDDASLKMTMGWALSDPRLTFHQSPAAIYRLEEPGGGGVTLITLRNAGFRGTITLWEGARLIASDSQQIQTDLYSSSTYYVVVRANNESGRGSYVLETKRVPRQ